MANYNEILSGIIQAEQDSLAALQLKQQATQDSIRQDSLEKVKRDQALLLKDQQDSLKKLIKLEDYDRINDQIVGPVASTYVSPNVKEKLGNEIINLTRESLLYEADTNVYDDLSQYQSLRDSILAIHSPFQRTEELPSGISPQYGGTAKELKNMLEDETLVKLHGANSMDRIWPSRWTEQGKMETFEMVAGPVELHAEDTYWTEDDPNLRNLTIARLVASDPEIKKVIYGNVGIDENGDPVKHNAGFLDILTQFSLTGETVQWEKIKEKMGFRANALQLLDMSLAAKKKGYNYFFDEGWDNAQWQFAGSRGAAGEFSARIKALPEAERKVILESLQNMTNDIYAKGIKIEEKADLMLDDYFRLSKKFPKRSKNIGELHSNTDTPYDNKNLVSLKEKEEDIHGLMHAYKMYTGEDYDLENSLNELSIMELGKELEGLPDFERTEALEQWLIKLADEFQAGNRLAQEYPPE